MSLKEKHLKEMIKDEKMGHKEYMDASKKAKTKMDKKTFKSMAKDEMRHKKNVEKMLKREQRRKSK